MQIFSELIDPLRAIVHTLKTILAVYIFRFGIKLLSLYRLYRLVTWDI